MLRTSPTLFGVVLDANWGSAGQKSDGNWTDFKVILDGKWLPCALRPERLGWGEMSAFRVCSATPRPRPTMPSRVQLRPLASCASGTKSCPPGSIRIRLRAVTSVHLRPAVTDSVQLRLQPLTPPSSFAPPATPSCAHLRPAPPEFSSSDAYFRPSAPSPAPVPLSSAQFRPVTLRPVLPCPAPPQSLPRSLRAGPSSAQSCRPPSPRAPSPWTVELRAARPAPPSSSSLAQPPPVSSSLRQSRPVSSSLAQSRPISPSLVQSRPVSSSLV